MKKKKVKECKWKMIPGYDQDKDPEWIVNAIKKNDVWFSNEGTNQCMMNIVTLEGTMHANIGDWIIKGIKGELYPCKPGIFEATYEPVEQDNGGIYAM